MKKQAAGKALSRVISLQQTGLTGTLNQHVFMSLNEPADIWVSDPVTTFQTFTLCHPLRKQK